MKILAITQARVGSSRLPEKILKEIDGEALLSIHLRRILESKKITKLKVATTTETGVDSILSICRECKVEFYQGSLNDVLARFYLAAVEENPDWIVRLTSDCPLIDSDVIDEIISFAINNDYDYVSNGLNPTYPDGLDVEVFKFSALRVAYLDAKLVSEREHVTPYIWKNSDYNGGNLFKAYSYENSVDFSSIRLTVDTKEDYDVLEKLISIEGKSKKWKVYVETLNSHPEIKKLNQEFKRNEGYEKSLISENK
jgi:spore coat polysaccharide biosynthesis protein SpsF